MSAGAGALAAGVGVNLDSAGLIVSLVGKVTGA
jgi:hypothetical protein